MAESKKEVIVKSKVALTMPEGGWGDGDFTAKDIMVPSLFIGQGTSEVVKQGKVGVGQVYESITKAILADTKKQVKFVPVKLYKTWIHTEVVGGRAEYRAQEPYNTGNANKYAQFEDELKADGTVWRHFECLNFYVLLEDDLKAGNPFPYLLSFRSSNMKKGRPLVNHLARARSLNPPQPLCSMMFSLNTVLTTKGKDSWFLFDLASACPTSTPFMEKSLEWLDTLNTMNHKIDEIGLKEEMGQAEVVDVSPPVKKGEVTKEARY